MSLPATQDDLLHLVPEGYPVSIDVAQASIAGAGTAMHFVLPIKGHNLPLTHQRESKLVAALEGELEIRSGGVRIALLRQGDAVLLKTGIAHRIHQHGDQAATVGVALWPGQAEQAFRDMAALVTNHQYSREAIIRILANYDIAWHGAAEGTPVQVEAGTLDTKLDALPTALAQAIRLRWAATIRRHI
ncbi:hypothetical protein KW842_17745 [Duganella sp. sic0402]|uniref:cupin domain-containing protein n=1 Tax=Duganella sp. sic0402 TaxID=2854786 RepID=UPI001C437390|nr:cupin domain-containing protein [Duganella sp. sic0402]MBV7537614.1 hypothetical protein [Duganella sp. sic0402]